MAAFRTFYLLNPSWLHSNGCQSQLTTHSVHNNMMDVCVDEQRIAWRDAHTDVVSHAGVS